MLMFDDLKVGDVLKQMTNIAVVTEKNESRRKQMNSMNSNKQKVDLPKASSFFNRSNKKKNDRHT